MAYLIFLLITIALFAGFLLATYREERRGRRYFEEPRQELDARVARIEFIVTHVDFAAFVRDTVKSAAEQAAHDVAHATLVAVRWSERMLTRAVRTLRERRAEMSASNGGVAVNADGTPAAPAQASEFARAINDFKQDLRARRADAETADTDGVE